MTGPWHPISDYGIIGDLRTAALVGRDGGIDWCCVPRFDSGSIFAALLDPDRGGSWRIHPAGAYTTRQAYRPGTAILETIFETPGGGRVELTDFMPVTADGRPDGPHPEIHRRLRGLEGPVPMDIVFQPRFEYAARATRIEVLGAGLYASDRSDQVATLASARPFDWTVTDGAARTTFDLATGEDRWLVLRYDDDDVHPVDRYDSAAKLAATEAFWVRWAGMITYVGPFRAEVERSALTLKLLHHAESGAIIAAPTTSLPEAIPGGRNWDYRFVWLRDAAFTLAALDAIGHHEEAGQFLRFLKRVCRHEGAGHLQIMYGVDGRRDIEERTLDHLRGYRDTGPVRVGNGAAGQRQLDVYGEVLETAEIWRRRHEMTDGAWRVMGGLVEWVSHNWHLPDSSIWEVRGAPRQYVFSKVMSWAALDRGARIARELELPGDVAAWESARDALHADILARGMSADGATFVQAYDEPVLDAALLVIPMVGFLPWSDPRIVATVRAIARDLTAPDGALVFRYRVSDGLDGQEGAFVTCSFWLAEALAGIGDAAAAEQVFRTTLGHASALGLFSEEIDPGTGEFRGNFPQGLSHIALVNAATALARTTEPAKG
ncbi:MAG TPA: glycoside hydrolase family 15 protein [Gemmatimonadales bacterium]|nr:glycoside hydrolase family 15 protein [Gemmatimonadales bacterium]